MEPTDAWLDGTVAPRDPIELFQTWFQAAVESGTPEPTAVALATATADGRPSVRMVLLKGVDAGGFVFFTNYESRKGRELAANPRAGLTFFWAAMGRQVRIEGRVVPVSRDESDAYFASRPRDSQLGAWASSQSEEIESRAALDARLEAVRERHGDGNVPRPPHWGGFRVQPDVIEFWASRPNRMHDRFEYRRDGAEWRRRRLCP